MGGQLVFECPYCRTRRGKPITHRHGAGGPNPGDGDGSRAAHCHPESPLSSGYYIREIEEN